jgi:signal transduction histidine kinase
MSLVREKFAEFLDRWLHLAAPAVLLVLALSLKISGSPLIAALSNRSFDVLQTAHPRPYEPVPVRVIDIDEASLEKLGQWPWPRDLIARLVDRLSALGASTIALDIIFPGADKVSAKNDAVLAAAMAKANVVTSFALTSRGNDAVVRPKAGFAHMGDSPLSYLENYSGAVGNIAEIEKAAKGNGNLTIVPEPDGLIRRVNLLYRRDAVLYPNLSLEVLRVAQGAEAIAVKSSGASGELSFGTHTGISQIKVGGVVVPTDAAGRLWLYYSPRAAERTIPAWKIMDPSFKSPELEGAIALVGTSAIGLSDLRSTPLSPLLPGVEIHAQAVEQMLTGRFLRRPDWASGAELVYLVVLGAGMILLLPRLSALWCGAIGLAVVLAGFAASWAAFVRFNWLVDPLLPALTALLIYLSSSLISYVRSERERRKLIILDMVKDEFIATVSHDLRGPVNAMLMVVDLMERGIYGPLTDKQKHNLKLIKDSGRKLTAFVSNILDAAKIKAGKIEFHKTEVKPQEMLPAIAELFALSAGAKSLKLEHAVPDDIPSISGDREKLEQVVNNLVGNAMKFTPSGGTITLEARPEDAFVRISVVDTGLGISAEDLPKLFKKFQQVDLAAQKDMRVVGTGLGLSICKSIVEAHGGRIWVESEKGKGSAFRFTIPRFQPAAPGP